MEHCIKHIEVVAAVIERDEKFLVAQRPENVHLAYKWEFPGGKLEESETHQQALKREIMEELNIDITIGEQLFDIEHEYPERTIHLFFYHATYKSGNIWPNEHLQIKWVEKQHLKEMPLAEGDMAFARQFTTD